LCCAFNPVWARIYALYKAGVPRYHMHMIVKKPQSHIFAIVQLMEPHAIIDPKGWRDEEMAFRIFDPLHPAGEYHVNLQREMREEAKAAQEAEEKAKADLANGELDLATLSNAEVAEGLTPVKATPIYEPTPMEQLLTDPSLQLPEDAPDGQKLAPSTDTLQ
jgi:hypothetical protein